MRRNGAFGAAVAIAVLGVALFGQSAIRSTAAASSAATFVDYAQCANDQPPSTSLLCPQGWINGILQSNNSHYSEDQVTPQRAQVTVPAGGPATGRTLTFRYEARKGSIHAYDSLATWNHTQTGADRCQGLTGTGGNPPCVGGSASTFPIPLDPTAVPTATHLTTATSDHQLTGQVFTMYGGTITGVSTYSHDSAANPGTDDFATVTITYSVPDTTVDRQVQLLFGGHLAASSGPRGWGAGLGSASVNGGPYHIKWDFADGESIGNRDNQIMAGAILINPATTLTTKSVTPGTTVEAGTSVTITVTESNTGDSTITNANITGTGCTTYSPASVASLAAGASTDFTCTFTANSTTAWAATGHGTDAQGNPVPTTGETTSGTVTVISPATTLTTKSVSPSGVVDAGTSVTITVTETNSGNSPITNVSVTGTGCTTYTPATLASLAVGASADFSCTFSPATTTSWTATGHGTDSLGHAVPATGETTSGTVNVTVNTPATTLTTKSVSPSPAVVGQTVTVVVTETNTGNVALTAVSVNGGGSCATFSGGATTLAVGASTDFTCTFTAVAGANAWSADGHGMDPTGAAVPSTGEHASGSVTGLTVSTSLTLKSVTAAPILVGGTVTVVVTETNTGTAALTGVSVTGGGSCGSLTGGATTLAAGASTDFTCTFTAVAGTNNWSALGHGTDPTGAAAPSTGESVSGSVTGLAAATTLTTKSVTPAPILVGDTVTVVVTETNSGTAALTGVSVSGGGSCATFSGGATTLAAGASSDFTCTFTAVAGTNSWSADGHGTDPNGAPASATGEHQEGSVTGLTVSTTLALKSATPDPAIVGQTVTIVVTETNTGTADLTGVNVTGGGSCASFTGGSTTLAAGASTDFTCTFTAVNGTNNWSADGHGTDPNDNGAPSTGEHASGSVTGQPPAVAATTLTTKSVSPGTSVAAGTSVTITVTESNTGNVGISNVSVSGSGCTPYAPVGSFSGSLAAGASQDFSCTFTANSTTSWTATGHGIDPQESQVPSTGETTSGTVTMTPPPPPPPPPPFFPPTGTVTVIKHVVNSNGGTMTAANFSVHLKTSGGTDVSGSPQAGSESGTAYVLGTGTYAVSEDAPPQGYVQTSISCDGTATATIAVVSAGDTHTCTVTNSDQPGLLTVIKHVVNLTGTARASDFTMTVTGSSPSAASFAGSESGTTVTLKAGAYSVSESAHSGYTETLSADCSGTIAIAQAKTCTITNTENPLIAPPTGTLTVIKHVIPVAGATKTAADFTVHVKLNGTDVAGSPHAGSETGTAFTLNTGTYTISEDTPPAGYAQVSITCDGIATATVTVASAGDTHTCTITNQATPVPPAPPNSGNSSPTTTPLSSWWILLALLGSLGLIGTGTAALVLRTRRA